MSLSEIQNQHPQCYMKSERMRKRRTRAGGMGEQLDCSGHRSDIAKGIMEIVRKEFSEMEEKLNVKVSWGKTTTMLLMILRSTMNICTF